MRVQMQNQSLRLRIDETELAELLHGQTVSNQIVWPDGQAACQQVTLGDASAWQHLAHGWCLTLAHAAVSTLASRLPCRDGLTLTLPVPDAEPLAILFDVDVRDSAHRQHAKKHAAHKDAP